MYISYILYSHSGNTGWSKVKTILVSTRVSENIHINIEYYITYIDIDCEAHYLFMPYCPLFTFQNELTEKKWLNVNLLKKEPENYKNFCLMRESYYIHLFLSFKMEINF